MFGSGNHIVDAADDERNESLESRRGTGMGTEEGMDVTCGSRAGLKLIERTCRKSEFWLDGRTPSDQKPLSGGILSQEGAASW